jgi:hypothetical protein
LTRRILILALAMGLTACSAVKERFAFLRHVGHPTATASASPASDVVQPAPKPAEGLWAILDPGCPKPSLTNFQSWPKCASPFWISHGMAMIVRSRPGPRAPNQSYRAEYRLAAGDPVIAQVGSDKDGYLFLALTDVAKDNQGRMVAATGAAFACPAPRRSRIALQPTATGCDNADPDALRQAARDTLADRASLTRVEWIASGAPA